MTEAHRSYRERWASSRCQDCGAPQTHRDRARCRACHQLHREAQSAALWRSYRKRNRRGCLIWTGPVDKDGYGVWRNTRAYVWAWEAEHGPVPQGMQLHHRCEDVRCTKPAHLVLLTPAEHRRQHRKTHCVHGHVLTERYGRQVCDTCRRNQAREYQRRKRAQ